MSHISLARELRDSIARFLQVLEDGRDSPRPEPRDPDERLSFSDRELIDRVAFRARMGAAECHEGIEGWDDFSHFHETIAQASVELSRTFAQVFDGRGEAPWWAGDSPWLEDL